METLEELVCFVGVMLGDEDVAAIFEHERASAFIADGVGGDGADNTAGGSGQRYQDEIEP